MELDKFPTFVNKKFKNKKQQGNANKNHNFFDHSFPVKTLCYKCNFPFWGIGCQGLQCQSI